jgi:hypothetical protein
MRPTIITLSTIPPRLPHLGPVLRSLLEQDMPAQAVVLYLPETWRRFPGWDGAIPALPDGITLRRCVDYGPATKVLPALQEYAGADVDLLFCDDDSLYSQGWHRAFKTAAAYHPGAAIAMQAWNLPQLNGQARARQPRAEAWGDDRAGQARWLAMQPPPLPLEMPYMKSSGYADVFLGRGGVLVRPEFFGADVFDPPPVIWAVDDFWLSGHLETRGVPIWADAQIPNPLTLRPLHLINPLMHEVIEGHNRDAANRACIRWYQREKGIWKGPGQCQKKVKANPGILARAKRLLRRLLAIRA